MTLQRLVVAFGLGLSCGAAAAPGTLRPQLELRVDRFDELGARALAPGGEVQLGERIAIWVAARPTAYIYLALASSDGKAARLFPADAGKHVAAQQWVRIPAPGKRFEVEGAPGDRNLLVLFADPRPLPDEKLNLHVQHMAAALARRVALTSVPKDKAPPPGLSEETRALREVDEALERLCQAQPAFAVRCFSFKIVGVGR